MHLKRKMQILFDNVMAQVSCVAPWDCPVLSAFSNKTYVGLDDFTDLNSHSTWICLPKAKMNSSLRMFSGMYIFSRFP